MTPSELLSLATGATTGTWIKYYEGFMSKDLENLSGKLDVWRILQMSRSLMQYGVVMLTQKKLGEDKYAYYAVRTEKKLIPPVLQVVVKELEAATKMRAPSSWWGNGTV